MPTPEQVIELQGDAARSSRQDPGLWSVLAGTRDAPDFCQAWLRLQCEQVAGATAALLLLDDGEGHFSSAAGWPDSRQDLSFLATTAQQALSRRTSFIDQPASTAEAGDVQIGQPIESQGRLMGVVVVALKRPAADFPAVIRQLRWGIGWLELLFVRQQNERDSGKLARTGFALSILSEAQQHTEFRATALSIANELASKLDCTNVSVGFTSGKSIRLIAMSHSAVFSAKSQIVSTIENAMEEAADQNASVAFPVTPGTERRIALAHEDLAKRSGGSAVVSVLMTNGVQSVGVILLERIAARQFDDPTIETLEAVAALVGPGLETKAETNKLIAGRAVNAIGSGTRALFGSGRPRHQAFYHRRPGDPRGHGVRTRRVSRHSQGRRRGCNPAIRRSSL